LLVTVILWTTSNFLASVGLRHDGRDLSYAETNTKIDNLCR
jgi:hypothetical protein